MDIKRDPTKKSTVALFDFDGTLFDGHIIEGMLRFFVKRRYRFRPTLSYLFSHSLLYPANRVGLLSDEEFYRGWGEDLARVLGGLNRDEVNELFKWLTDSYVLERTNPTIVKILRQHQGRGQIVILLSGTFHKLLEMIGRKLGVFHAVGTKLEIQDGRYTGKIVPPFCFGTDKVNLFKEFANSIRLDIDLDDSFTYADSIFDVPMLEMVGHPVAVHPDGKLRQLALQRGWQIVEK